RRPAAGAAGAGPHPLRQPAARLPERDLRGRLQGALPEAAGAEGPAVLRHVPDAQRRAGRGRRRAGAGGRCGLGGPRAGRPLAEGPYLRCLRAEVRALAAQVLAWKGRAAEVERAMAAVQAAAGPARGAEVARMLTLPQVGLTTAAALVGETGDPTRFGGDANRYVAYSGLAPAVHQSGAGGP